MALSNGGALPNEDYANNKRTVTSSTTVLDTDSLLNVNTTSGAITITLKEIPTRFSTMYSLYVKDIGNYAATNNITITAPTGFKVNGQQSVTIDTNGLSCQIIITSNTDYICNGLASSVVGVQDYDTGWINLDGFGHMTSALRPQYRVINRLLQFRGTAVIPLSNGAAVIAYTSENSYINSAFSTAWTGGGTGSVRLVNADTAPNFGLGFNSSGTGSTITDFSPVIPNTNRYPDNSYSFNGIIATRRVRAQGSTTHGVCYNAPCTLVFQTDGTLWVSLLSNLEDGNWASNQSAPYILDKTNTLRILGTNAIAGEYYSEYGTLNSGNAVQNTDTLIKGITNNDETVVTPPSGIYGFKHAITVDITDSSTLGGFQIVLDGLSMDISRSIPLTTIHA